MLHGAAPVDDVVSAVGAGDALLAGYLFAADDTTEALTSALAWGAAAVQHHGTLFTATRRSMRVTISRNVARNRTLRSGSE